MSTATHGDPADTPEAASERCGQCGAPAAHDQRYCLSCGFHRRNAPDPVSRYLSEASAARTRVAAATALAAQRRRAPRLGPRPVAVLVALALLAGLVIGNAIGAGSPATGTTSSRQTTPHTAAKHSTTVTKHSTNVKNRTGSSYVQQEQNLPNSVTP